VLEYWYVDLESDRVEVYRLEHGRYGSPRASVPGRPARVSPDPRPGALRRRRAGPAGGM